MPKRKNPVEEGTLFIRKLHLAVRRLDPETNSRDTKFTTVEIYWTSLSKIDEALKNYVELVLKHGEENVKLLAEVEVNLKVRAGLSHKGDDLIIREVTVGTVRRRRKESK